MKPDQPEPTTLEEQVQRMCVDLFPILKSIRDQSGVWIAPKFRQGYVEAATDALIALEWLQAPKEYTEVVVEKKPYRRRDIKLFPKMEG